MIFTKVENRNLRIVEDARDVEDFVALNAATIETRFETVEGATAELITSHIVEETLDSSEIGEGIAALLNYRDKAPAFIARAWPADAEIDIDDVEYAINEIMQEKGEIKSADIPAVIERAKQSRESDQQS